MIPQQWASPCGNQCTNKYAALTQIPYTNRKWVIAGIALRAPLKLIFVEKAQADDDHIKGEEEECSTTQTEEESRIKTTLKCPLPKGRENLL
ncbi:Cyclin-dependent kinase inhibitor SMR3-like protein [Quillaja saponaria]|uniref:Cyclin-dependent kinase inhibitor SMR3-like protein n=1 Tax=Quillaja saponaria TaxID=32244 RepID=A0AAD7KXZ1_QUISA|nr:Cyclin-dependent kinase inhibitor SMR3-like protein [Quillaja saponaria]